MILESTNTDFHAEVDMTVDAGAGVIGDPSELTEMAIAAMTETHNLTIALARFEHKCIVESTGGELLQEAIGEYFAKAKDAIVAWIKKFIAWVKGIFDRLRTSVFGPRKDWLEKHVGELGKMSNFGDAKFKIGKNLLGAGSHFSGMMASIANYSPMDAAKKAVAGMKDDELSADIQKQMTGVSSTAGKTFAAVLDAELIGEEQEVAIQKPAIGKLLALVEDTNKMVEELPKIVAKAEQTIKVVENTSKTLMGEAADVLTEGKKNRNRGNNATAPAAAPAAAKSDDGDSARRARMNGVRVAGHVMQTVTSALLSCGTKANGMAMSALVKAYNAGKPHLNESAAPAGAQGGLLGAYM